VPEVRDMLMAGRLGFDGPRPGLVVGRRPTKGRHLVDDGGASPRLVLLNGAGSSIFRAPVVILVGVVVRAVRLDGDGLEYASL
jgi:hypothetical protein